VRKLCALKGACTVSRGGGRSNVASLPAELKQQSFVRGTKRPQKEKIYVWPR